MKFAAPAKSMVSSNMTTANAIQETIGFPPTTSPSGRPTTRQQDIRSMKRASLCTTALGMFGLVLAASAAAQDMMADLGVRHLGVTKDGKLVGMISVRDLVVFLTNLPRK